MPGYETGTAEYLVGELLKWDIFIAWSEQRVDGGQVCTALRLRYFLHRPMANTGGYSICVTTIAMLMLFLFSGVLSKYGNVLHSNHPLLFNLKLTLKTPCFDEYSNDNDGASIPYSVRSGSMRRTASTPLTPVNYLSPLVECVAYCPSSNIPQL